MIKRTSFILIGVLVLASLLAVGCSKSNEGAQQEQKKIEMRFGMQAADLVSHPSSLTNGFFVEELYKRLGRDRINITFYFNGQLGNTGEQILGGVLNRTAEFMDFNFASYADYTTAFTPIETPYLFLDPQQAYDLIDGEAFKIMQDQAIKDSGLRLLYLSNNGFRQFTNNRYPITSPDQMRGMKFRVMMNPVYISLVEVLGGLATPISFSELYIALQQRVVDGQENPITTYIDLKYYETSQTYMTLTNHVFGSSSCVMSDEYYQSLPADIRQAIDECALLAQKESRKFLEKFEDEQLAFLRERITVTELTQDQMKAFQDRAKTMWPEVMKLTSEEYFNKIVSYIK